MFILEKNNQILYSRSYRFSGPDAVIQSKVDKSFPLHATFPRTPLSRGKFTFAAIFSLTANFTIPRSSLVEEVAPN